MKFGVITPNLNSPGKLVEFAKAVEEAGSLGSRKKQVLYKKVDPRAWS